MDMAENTTSSVEVKKKYNNKKKQNLMVFRPDGKKNQKWNEEIQAWTLWK